ncbi:GMC family oxidoreductase N-terminal domain-containing protein [Rhizobium sp. B230/85]|uniref:GMC family oxidoreductase n=1 Tax=unclassified Rhizobium TaxID=2613769 RepID=UPI001ADD5091|nr:MULTISPECIES: GMC family oxidoreductase N-terminal domain-containing protein [unclassified Rhizobium]MBO9134967.1 GMC family oxidoreductase N-terminal domain-containing protein [Rhizobium sp. B209b/85]QXZ98108.1 GMC family oxidoreductase N-terminal domain-containing protein [Rhizobium sp. B230/85]
MSAVAIPQKPLSRAYDYIVVGSGSGGCAVARRLIDGSNASVLLIEAGSSGFGIPEIEDPAAWVPLGRSRYDWGYDYAPTPAVNNRVIGIPRGKVLGGSSSINAMMWYRGHPMDYDAWEAAGAKGWSFKDMLPFFKRSEDWEDGASDLRGAGGPLRIERCATLHPTAAAMLDGARALGIPVIDDPNGPDNEGAAVSNFNISGGKRWSSAKGYLEPVLDNERLTVATNSFAIRLGIANGRCVSVTHLVDGRPHETEATTGIVLALGAIDTPRLLMMSGIGDPAELRRLGIDVRAALAGVGRNLQDHPLVQACVFRARQPLGPTIGNGGGTMMNWKSSTHLPQADLHAFPVQGNSAEPRIRELYDLPSDVFSIGCGLMRSKSVGYLRLLSPEPGGALEIQPNYLAEPSDLDALVTSVEMIMALAATPAYADWFGGYAAPPAMLGRKDIIAYIRNACSTFFHVCGTCAMGSGEMAVVDSRLRVTGVAGLTIADASVIPIIPTCNTHAPVTMIGERAADFLLTATGT